MSDAEQLVLPAVQEVNEYPAGNSGGVLLSTGHSIESGRRLSSSLLAG